MPLSDRLRSCSVLWAWFRRRTTLVRRGLRRSYGLATFEGIGWTPIHLRRWLRVKQLSHWIGEDFVSSYGPATFEEIGWTPIHLRRWLRVKQLRHWIGEDFVSSCGLATFEEIGWTPIHLRRWLRVKQLRHCFGEDSDAVARQVEHVGVKEYKSGRSRSSTPAAHQSGNANLLTTRPWSQQMVIRTIHLCSSGQLFLPTDEGSDPFGQQS